MSNFSYAQLQNEQAPWTLHNFGAHDSSQPFRGLVEEFGELDVADAVVDVEDALADVMIYAADYCNTKGWSLDKIAAEAAIMARAPWKPEKPESFILRNLGALAHADLKAEQKIRITEDHDAAGQVALAKLVAVCIVMARSWNRDLLTITEQVWAKVRLRDFKKYPSTGLPAAP